MCQNIHTKPIPIFLLRIKTCIDLLSSPWQRFNSFPFHRLSTRKAINIKLIFNADFTFSCSLTPDSNYLSHVVRLSTTIFNLFTLLYFLVDLSSTWHNKWRVIGRYLGARRWGCHASVSSDRTPSTTCNMATWGQWLYTDEKGRQ